MSDQVTIRRRHAFSSVPDAVLEHPTLSHAAVRALAWALGRPNGWELRIGNWCKRCGLTDKTWPSVKKQLITEGFFRQWKMRGERGVFAWRQEITDEPLFTIPPSGRDGAGKDARGRDGAGKDARGRDAPGRDARRGGKTIEIEQEDSKQEEFKQEIGTQEKQQQAPDRRTAPPASQSVVVFSDGSSIPCREDWHEDLKAEVDRAFSRPTPPNTDTHAAYSGGILKNWEKTQKPAGVRRAKAEAAEKQAAGLADLAARKAAGDEAALKAAAKAAAAGGLIPYQVMKVVHKARAAQKAAGANVTACSNA